MRANMLNTAKPDPVISANMHHCQNLLCLAARNAIPEFLTLRIAASGRWFEQEGPVERSALFAVRLSGIRNRIPIS